MPNLKRKGSIKGHAGSAERVAKMPERNDVIRTPEWLIDVMIDWANIQKYEKVLDPFAGDNRIIDRVWTKSGARYLPDWTTSIEIRKGECKTGLGEVIETDFFSILLPLPSEFKYDVVMMNPPFSESRAYLAVEDLLKRDWLTDNGRIISVMPDYSYNNALSTRRFLNKHLYRLAFLPNTMFRPDCEKLHGALVEFRKDLTKAPPLKDHEFYLFDPTSKRNHKSYGKKRDSFGSSPVKDDWFGHNEEFYSLCSK